MSLVGASAFRGLKRRTLVRYLRAQHDVNGPSRFEAQLDLHSQRAQVTSFFAYQ